jgi:hypothetical protein
VPGRIFEKKTALWVYSMIRDSERRDPGILFYRSAAELELRVFPVVAGTATRVEIDFLTPLAAEDAPTTDYNIDPAHVVAALGARREAHLAETAHGTLVVGKPISLGEDPAAREPYFHVIIDRSEANAFEGSVAEALAVVERQYGKNHYARVTAGNYEAVDLASGLASLDELEKRAFAPLDRLLPARGGLALDLIVARGLRQFRDSELNAWKPENTVPPRPVFVVVGKKAAARTIDWDLTNAWSEGIAPEMELVELDTANGQFIHRAYSGIPPVLVRLGSSIRPWVAQRPVCFENSERDAEVRVWSQSDRAWRPLAKVRRAQGKAAWLSAASLERQHQELIRHSKTERSAAATLVSASRESGILLPVSSYIVVENSAQWKMLEQSQKTKLAQNSALEFKETPAPGLAWIAAGLLIWWVLRRRWKGRAFGLRRRAAQNM